MCVVYVRRTHFHAHPPQYSSPPGGAQGARQLTLPTHLIHVQTTVSLGAMGASGRAAADGIKLRSFRIPGGLEATASLDPKYQAFPSRVVSPRYPALPEMALRAVHQVHCGIAAVNREDGVVLFICLCI
jgi:hypothetical protein